MSLSSFFRTLYTLGRGIGVGLTEAHATADPIELFGKWYEEAERAGILLPEALSLSTATPEGRPSSRMVLLKSYDPHGFVFFTNYGSRKSRELEANPYAALLFHWAVLQRQVRIEGPVEKVSSQESYAYFRIRPRGSRIGAWASRQSAPLSSRAELQQRVRRFEEKFKGQEIPLPPFWGGFRVIPERIEFWQGRTHRLHDRLRFERDGDGWRSVRLYP